MNKTKRFALGLVFVIGLVILLSTVWVTAAPPVPASYYGTLLVNGANPPLPATVEALIGGVVYATANGQVSGPSVVYAIDVPADWPETPGTKEGGVVGDLVQFRVLGIICSQSTSWSSGLNALNLTATGTLPTASPTPTATLTPAVTSTPVTKDLKTTNTTIRDTDINSWNKTDVQPTARRNRLYVRQDIYNALSWFDIESQVPQGATVQSATLHMYLSYYEHQMTQSPVVSVYQVKQPWNDLQATWMDRLTGVAWFGEGCSGALDRALTPSASAVVTAVSTWYHWDITPLVQTWASNPSQNMGMALISDNSRELRFFSADDADPRYQPYLSVTYTTGVAAPTVTPQFSPTPTKTPSVTGVPELFEQQGAIHDTFISGWVVDKNYDGASQRLAVRGNGTMRTLIKFDLTGIPEGARIDSASLRLTTFEYDDGKTHLTLDIGAYLVNKQWLENQATWNVAMTGVPWYAAGCSAVPGDRDGSPASTTPVRLVSAPTGPGVSYTWDVTSIAQAWVDDLSEQAGLMMMSNDASEREVRFIHTEDPRTDRWPLLRIYWVAPLPTVTPTATSSPTPTMTATPSGGTVAGVVFNDNIGGLANGVRDPGEGGIAGALVQLWQGTSFIDEQTTIGAGTFSFSEVPAGSYTIVMTPPSGYLLSPGTLDRRTISVVLGQTTEVLFGLYDPLVVTPLQPLVFPLIRK